MKLPHFTLRTLLIVTACIALLTAYLVLPTIKARRFENAIRQSDRAGAIAMLDESARGSSDFMDALSSVLGVQTSVPSGANLYLEKQSLGDMLRGERRVCVSYYHGPVYQFRVSMFAARKGDVVYFF